MDAAGPSEQQQEQQQEAAGETAAAAAAGEAGHVNLQLSQASAVELAKLWWERQMKKLLKADEEDNKAEVARLWVVVNEAFGQWQAVAQQQQQATIKSARELLRSALPVVVEISSRSQSTEYGSYPWPGLKVSQWENFTDEVLGVIGHHEQHLNGMQLGVAAFPDGQDVQFAGDEGQFRTAFLDSAAKLAVKSVKLPPGETPPVHGQGLHMPHSSEIADGFVRWSSESTRNGPPLLIIEVKRSAVLRTDVLHQRELDQLSQQQMSGSGIFNQHRLLLQTLSYLKQAGAKHAVLTSCDRNFFIKRIDTDHYKVSGVVRGAFQCPHLTAKMATYALVQISIDSPSPFKPTSKASVPQPVMEAAEPGGGASSSSRNAAGKSGGNRSHGMATRSHATKSHLEQPEQPEHGSKRRRADTGKGMLTASHVLRDTDGSVTLLGRLDGSPVAVKIVSLKKQQLVVALQHEAAVYGRLEHLQASCIPALRAAGSWHSMFVVVTDYLSGAHTLEELQTEGKPMPAGLAKEAEQALHHVHDAGVLHGDMHASNVMFQESPLKVWFLDFAGSRMDPPPTRQEKEAEMQELRNVLRGPRSSDASHHDYFAGEDPSEESN